MESLSYILSFAEDSFEDNPDLLLDRYAPEHIFNKCWEWEGQSGLCYHIRILEGLSPALLFLDRLREVFSPPRVSVFVSVRHLNSSGSFIIIDFPLRMIGLRLFTAEPAKAS